MPKIYFFVTLMLICSRFRYKSVDPNWLSLRWTSYAFFKILQILGKAKFYSWWRDGLQLVARWPDTLGSRGTLTLMVDIWNGVATPKKGKITASYFLSGWKKKWRTNQWHVMAKYRVSRVCVVDTNNCLPTNILWSLTSFSLGTNEACL